MKYFAVIATFLLTQIELYSQSSKDVAPRVFIPGERDTIINGLPSKTIDPICLTNGFTLEITDTTYKIVSFRITFDHITGISEMLSNGNRILPRSDSIVSLDKIVESTLITVESVCVSKEGFTGKLPAKLYYSSK